jgi:hypothetical protein
MVKGFGIVREDSLRPCTAHWILGLKEYVSQFPSSYCNPVKNNECHPHKCFSESLGQYMMADGGLPIVLA